MTDHDFSMTMGCEKHSKTIVHFRKLILISATMLAHFLPVFCIIVVNTFLSKWQFKPAKSLNLTIICNFELWLCLSYFSGVTGPGLYLRVSAVVA